MKKIVLISGKAEHGKTEFSTKLKEELEKQNYRVVITRFAYYLKDIATRYCNWDGKKDEAGRHLLQYLGTEVIRKELRKPLFHVSRICDDIEICQDCVDVVIIDDTRFHNEIYYTQAMFTDKVILTRVERLNPDGTKYESSLTDEQKKHDTEVLLDDFPFDNIIKASSIDELNEAAKSLADVIING